MFHDFPTPQAIKQVAKCPLGGSPGLVRGRFLSLCRGRGRKKALILQGCGLPLGGLGLWG